VIDKQRVIIEDITLHNDVSIYRRLYNITNNFVIKWGDRLTAPILESIALLQHDFIKVEEDGGGGSI